MCLKFHITNPHLQGFLCTNHPPVSKDLEAEPELSCSMAWVVMAVKHRSEHQVVYQDVPTQNTVIIVVMLELGVTALVVLVSTVVLQVICKHMLKTGAVLGLHSH